MTDVMISCLNCCDEIMVIRKEVVWPDSSFRWSHLVVVWKVYLKKRKLDQRDKSGNYSNRPVRDDEDLM